jgi:hypothetical protein
VIPEPDNSAQALCALQLEDFPKKLDDFLSESAFASLALHAEHF